MQHAEVSSAGPETVGLPLSRTRAECLSWVAHGALRGCHCHRHWEPPALCSPDELLPCLPRREIIALVAQVVPIYAVSHLFEGLAVSILRHFLKHLLRSCCCLG